MAKKPDLTLVGTDKSGRKRKIKLRAQVIGPSKEQIKKAEGEDNADVATSQALEEEFSRLLRGQSGVLVEPPFNLKKLAWMREISTELGQAIDAIVTNTVGFGWRLKPRRVPDDKAARLGSQMEAEYHRLMAQLEAVHPIESLTMLLWKAKQDKHDTGNGYLELIDDRQGSLVGLNHVHGHTIRLTIRDKKPTKIEVPVVRPDLNFTIEEKSMWYRFRRFVQIQGRRLVWFKEAGDPRQMSKHTGEFADTVPFGKRATSLLRFSVYSALSPYGVPKQIGNTYSIFGSREAEYANYETLKNNSVPSMFVIVENGVLTEASIERLREWTEQHIQSSPNYSKFILLEGDTSDEGAPTPDKFRIRVEPLKSIQHTDELYQSYDQNNRDKIRQCFRLPPIFVGRADDYTRATADTSRDIADEQVFAPERTTDDHLINRHILARWDARFHTYRSNHPNITDDIELIRLMAIAEKSGAMTPRRADRIIRDVFQDDIGPMPQGINLDKPFTVTFAEAQQGMTGGGEGEQVAEGAEHEVKRMIDGLLDLRSRVEKELDDRLLDEAA